MATVAFMDAWEAITSRRQVRSFTSESIPEADLDQILEAGRRAPSARNGQPWDFVVLTDPEAKAELSKVWGGAGWTADAAAVVAIVLADSVGDQATFDRFDMGQAAMQMMIAATGLGIGSGQAHAADQALAQQVIGFPDGKVCALLIALGYPADRPLRPIQKPTRRSLDDVVHRGGW